MFIIPILFNLTIFCLSIFNLLSCTSFTATLLRDPQVNVQAVTLKKISTQDVLLDCELKIDNPNPIPINLGTVTYNLKFSGENVAMGTFEKGIQIPASESSIVTLPLVFKYQSLENLFLSALKGTLSKNYELNGSVKIGILNLPFAKSGVIELK